MLRKHDQVYVAIKLVADDQIDPYSLGEFLELLTQFLRLVVVVMLAMVSIFNALDRLTAWLWDGWDTAWAGLRWQLVPLRVAPIG